MLTVTIDGDGSGEVTVWDTDQDGLNGTDPGQRLAACETGQPPCTTPTSIASIIQMTAVPNAGSIFSGWSGDCQQEPGTPPLPSYSFEVDRQDRTCNARFEPVPQYVLTVDLTGSGSGTVTSTPAGIGCPGVSCSAEFQTGTTVHLIAEPAGDSDFIEWIGAGCGTGPSDTAAVSMVEAKTCVARFDRLPWLIVTTSGDGTGTVTGTPGDINVPPADSAQLPFGERVVLTAVTGQNSTFGGWSGDCDGPGEIDTVRMGQPNDASPGRACDARFDAMVTATITVHGDAGTEASVDVAPLGATCVKAVAEVLATCVYSVVKGTQLTLTANAGTNAELSAWRVNGITMALTVALVVAMTESMAIDAVFQAIQDSPFQFVAQLGVMVLADALSAGRPATSGGAARGTSAALADLSSVFVGGSGGGVEELNLSDPANIVSVGDGLLCEGLNAVVHADHPTAPEGVLYGFSGTVQWSCVTGYPLGQAIGLFNMGSPTGKAILMPGNASTVLIAHWGAGALMRFSATASDFAALVPGVRSCPRFLKATATEVYLVTVEGTVGTPSEPCNTNRGLHRVRLSDNTVTGFVAFGTKPRDPVISADGSTVYVPDYAEHQIYVVDAASMTVTRTIAVPGGPVAAVLTADGTHLIVARWDVGDIALINATTGQGAGAIASGGVHPTALLLGENNVVVVLNYGDPDANTTGAIATFRYTIP